MSFCGYKYRFELYASHLGIGDVEDVHFHNFTITLYIQTMYNQSDANFDLERSVNEWLKPFQNQSLPKMKLFEGKDTTVEGIGNVIFDSLYDLIDDMGYELRRLDINENPVRTYSVSRELLDSTVNIISDVPFECLAIIDLEHNGSAITDCLDEQLDVLEVQEVETLEVQEVLQVQAIQDSLEDQSQSGNLTDKQKNIGRDKKRKFEGRLARIVAAFIGITLLVLMSIVTMYVIKISGQYPQESDTFCHLYRADLLLNNIKQGNWYPLYDTTWYNGVEIMRYWGPLPLYMIAGLEWMIQSNVLDAYVMFLGVIVVIGGSGWILIGIRYNRIILSTFIGLLWFYFPENIRVVIYEGNLPRGVINALLPFFFYFTVRLIEDKKKYAMWPLMLMSTLITLCHLGITLMIVATIILLLVIYARLNHNWKWILCALGTIVSGILIAGLWVVPALVGGAASGSSTNQVMQNFFESATVSLNFMNRYQGDGISFYFGISIFIICVIGIFVGTKKVKPGFLIALILFVFTTKAMYTVFVKMPFSQYLWMIRFIPIGLAAAMVSFIRWKQLKPVATFLLCMLLLGDCITSIQYIYFPEEQRVEDVSAELELRAENLMLSKAKNITNQRMALLDLSSYGSFAPYYITGVGNIVNYTFGAGWEGANTATNIVSLNAATENGWYTYLFDRALELGNDTVLIPINNLKKKDKDVNDVIEAATQLKYSLVENNGNSLLFHRNTISQFGVVTEYQNIAIGTSALGIAMIFPSFEEGNSVNINDYTFDELSGYHTIYLSDFTCDSKEAAEELLLRLSESGVQVYIDMNKVPMDKTDQQMELFDVKSQSITFNDSYSAFEYDGTTYNSLDFSSDIQEWNTIYLTGLDHVTGYCNMTEKNIPYIGTSKNENLHFVGLNLVYYLQTTKDEEVSKLLETIFGIDRSLVPVRRLVPITVDVQNDRIVIETPYDHVNTTLANIDIFSSNEKYSVNNHLVVVGKGTTTLYMNYPHITKGIVVTLCGIGLSLIVFLKLRKLKERDCDENIEEFK